MTEVYIADSRPFFIEEHFVAGLKLITEERQEQIQRMHHREDKCRSLAAGLLLEYGLRQRQYSLISSAEQNKVSIIHGKYGKPYLKGAEALYFNLSHAKDYAAAVFSNAETGIDIEYIRKNKQSIAEHFFTEEEAAYLREWDEDKRDFVFTELWTKKESYIKAAGMGMRLPLRDFSVLDGKNPFYSWKGLEGYCICVCGSILPQSEPVFIDLPKKILYNR